MPASNLTSTKPTSLPSQLVPHTVPGAAPSPTKKKSSRSRNKNKDATAANGVDGDGKGADEATTASATKEQSNNAGSSSDKNSGTKTGGTSSKPPIDTSPAERGRTEGPHHADQTHPQEIMITLEEYHAMHAHMGTSPEGNLQIGPGGSVMVDGHFVGRPAMVGAIPSAHGDPTKQGKGKDLSHVPCRFFKVGACTAGDACPFSHSTQEVPGQQKQVCQWFLKGNCRFGHKCALAHVLPGESPSMDRKNKKAAQIASKQGKSDHPEHSRSPPQHDSAHMDMAAAMNMPKTYSQTLRASLDGEKAHPQGSLPTSDLERVVSVGSSSSSPSPLPPHARPLMTSQRSLQAAATEFQPFGHQFSPPDQATSAALADLGSHPMLNSSNSGTLNSGRSGLSQIMAQSGSPIHAQTLDNFRPSSLDPSRPAPIGTPPNGGPEYLDVRRTSVGFMSSSPAGGSGFAGPAFPSTFLDGRPLSNALQGSSPGRVISSSVLGGEFAAMGRDIWGQRTVSSPSLRNRALSPSQLRPRLNQYHSDVFAMSDAEEDEDEDDDHGEEFLPSSLNELLTPRERARRLSRRESNSSAPRPVFNETSSFEARSNIDNLLNRQAQSATAAIPSEASRTRDIWGSSEPQTSRRVAGFNPLGSPPDTAPPDTGFQLGPSNSSLAFLSSMAPRPRAEQKISSAFILMAHSPSRPSPLHTAILDETEEKAEDRQLSRPQSKLVPMEGFQPVLSPGSRALQLHAPGQSLPQGVGAGLSRLHLQSNVVESDSARPPSSNNAAANTPTTASVWDSSSTLFGGVTNGAAAPDNAAQRRTSKLGKEEFDEEDLFDMDG